MKDSYIVTGILIIFSNASYLQLCSLVI